MLSEITTASPDWPALKGKVLDGGYEVGECLLTTPASASFKIRVLGDRFAQVVVNVFTPEAAPLEQVALWQEALQFRHTNISAPIAVGRLEWNGVLYPYVLLHKADENLAGAITERPLTAGETRELLRNVGAALEHLHANGFVHSSLAPEHVLAMGDAIKVSSTSIRRINTPLDDGEPTAAYRAPESASENLTVPSDIWCLGATLFEVLTQRKFEEGEDCRKKAESLPVPFDWIVERCLEAHPHDRPTLSEIFAMLSGAVRRPERPKPEPEPAPAPVAATPASESESAPEAAANTLALGAAASAGTGSGSTSSESEAGAAATAAVPASTEKIVTPVNGSVSAPAETPAAKPSPAPVTPKKPPVTAGSPPATGGTRSSGPSVVPKPNAPAGPRPVARPPAEPLRPKLTSTPKPVYTESRPRKPSFIEEKPTESPRAKFISYAFLAVVLVAGLLWLARPKPQRPQPTVNPAARTQTATPDSSSGAPPQQQPVTPAAPASAPPSTAGATTAPTAGSTAEFWRVVAFTYGKKDAAEQRVAAINRQHPDLNPEVFSRDGNGPFLVVLGGPMTREQANRMRQKARASGLPRDTYVQNFNH